MSAVSVPPNSGTTAAEIELNYHNGDKLTLNAVQGFFNSLLDIERWYRAGG